MSLRRAFRLFTSARVTVLLLCLLALLLLLNVAVPQEQVVGQQRFAEIVDLGGATGAGMVWRAAAAIGAGMCTTCLCLTGTRRRRRRATAAASDGDWNASDPRYRISRAAAAARDDLDDFDGDFDDDFVDGDEFDDEDDDEVDDFDFDKFDEGERAREESLRRRR